MVYNKEANDKYYSSLPGRYASLKKGARKRDIEVKLSKEQYIQKVTNSQCVYCGDEDFLGEMGTGIDRIDSLGIYEIENIDCCCWPCNHEKAVDKKEYSVKNLGVKSPNCKLTEKQVLEIRNKYIPREYTLGKLVKEYGVSFTVVRCIVKRITWKHI